MRQVGWIKNNQGRLFSPQEALLRAFELKRLKRNKFEKRRPSFDHSRSWSVYTLVTSAFGRRWLGEN